LEVLKTNTMKYNIIQTTNNVFNVEETNWKCETKEVVWTFYIPFESDMNGGTVRCVMDNTKEVSSNNATIEIIPGKN